MKPTIFLLTLITAAGCKTGNVMQKATGKETAGKETAITAAPATLVYKTRKDYRDYVPVLLSDDKTRIIAYPDPKDVKNMPKPSELEKGYLLDNRGINQNVAFLNITYEAYSRRAAAPSLNELQNMIQDKNPLTELCDCGTRYRFRNPEEELNALIKKGTLRTQCRVLK